MKKILHLISSPRKEASYSIKLGHAIVDKIKEAYPDALVNEVNLAEQNVPHLDAAQLQSFFTPVEQWTPRDEETTAFSERSIEQLMEADFIVIGAPLYNFTVPSSLKAWIDQIVRAGKTFKYGKGGPEGFVKGKKVYIAMASGGVYSEGAMQPYDFVAPYLQTTLGFLGMTDVKVFRAEGVSIPGVQEEALEKAIGSIRI